MDLRENQTKHSLEENPLISIIIVNYNGIKFIKRCLNSVLNSDYPNFEVIFIDNASTDGSYELVKESFCSDTRLRIIRNIKNLGSAEGRNIGAKNAKGDLLVFLDNDTEVESNWLKEMIKVFLSDNTIGAAQCKIIQLYDQRLIDSAGQFIDFLGYGYPRSNEEDKGQYNRVEDVFYADGAALIIRRLVCNQVSLNNSLFDTDYFPVYGDDLDLCWRVRLRGYRVVFIPTSVVYHARTATNLYKLSSRLIFSHAKNRIMTLIKNYSLRKLAKYMPFLLFWETVRAVILLNSKSDDSIAILKAILWNLKNLKKTWKKRLIVQQFIRKVPDSYIMKHMVKFTPVHLYHSFKKYYNLSEVRA
jgi:GT2 family glycosyltransferase